MQSNGVRNMVVAMSVAVVVMVMGALPQSTAMATMPPAAAEYVVNLDLSAEDRWSHVMPEYREVYNSTIKPWIDAQMPDSLRSIIEAIFAGVDHGLGEFGDEIAGLAAAVDMPVGDITFMNLLYDLTAGCTSIVAEQKDGTILHARNLDYSIPWLRNITAQIEFQRGGVTAFRCTTFVGYVGCLTGARDGAFSVTVDERDDGSGQIDNILAALRGGQSIGWFLRSNLDSTASFEEAVATFESAPLIAPVYIIVGGAAPGEGAIVTRNRTHAVDTWRLNPDAADGWFITETNYDHWKPNPTRDPRRQVAVQGMNDMGRAALSLPGMFKVLSTPPVLNAGTKYTVLISAGAGTYEAYVRTDAPVDVRYPRERTRFLF